MKTIEFLLFLFLIILASITAQATLAQTCQDLILNIGQIVKLDNKSDLIFCRIELKSDSSLIISSSSLRVNGNISLYNNAKLTIINSSIIILGKFTSINGYININETNIIGKIFLKGKTKLLASNLYTNISNINIEDSSIAYISTIQEVKYINNLNKTTIEIYGTSAVLANSNFNLKESVLYFMTSSKYPKAKIVMRSYENKIGILSNFTLSNLPSYKYKFMLKILANDGTTVYSVKDLEINTNIPLKKPPKPNLSINSSYYPILTWNDLNNLTMPILGYYIYRGDSPNNLEKIATVDANQTSFTDINISYGSTYYYAVSAYNEAGEGEISNIASITILYSSDIKREEFITNTWLPAIAILSILIFLAGYLLKVVKEKRA
jgi:hypothetical protein